MHSANGEGSHLGCEHAFWLHQEEAAVEEAAEAEAEAEAEAVAEVMTAAGAVAAVGSPRLVAAAAPAWPWRLSKPIVSSVSAP